MTLKIRITDHKPYCESGLGDTIWFEYEGTSYYVERWSTRHSSGVDVYTLDGDRDANDIFSDGDDWEELDELIEEFTDALANAETLFEVERRRQQALDQTITQFNRSARPRSPENGTAR